MVLDVVEGDGALAPSELHLQQREIPKDVADVGKPWCAEDDVDVDAEVGRRCGTSRC